MIERFTHRYDTLMMDGEVVKTPCFVSVAREDRSFGGREEGGWWYDTSEVVEVHYCANLFVLGKVMKAGGAVPRDQSVPNQLRLLRGLLQGQGRWYDLGELSREAAAL